MRSLIKPLEAWAGVTLLLVVFFALSFFPYSGRADSSNINNQFKVLAVTNKNNNAHLEFLKSLTSRINREGSKSIIVNVYTPDELDEYLKINNQPPEANIIIPVGSKAAFAVKELHLDIPVYFTLITSSTFDRIYDELKKIDGYRKLNSALFINHPPEKHLTFIHYTLPEIMKVCMISSHYHFKKNISFSLEFVLDVISNVDDFYSRLPSILTDCDALLASPDSVIYNKNSIRNILITAYKLNKPVIGYSKALVKAGALMSLYTTPNQIGEEVGDILIKLSSNRSHSLPKPGPPKTFSIEFNYWVANALGITLPAKDVLLKKLIEDFKKSP